jgi:chromosome partitioning protein
MADLTSIVVAVINQKGGVGKSTLVAHLALLAQLDGFLTVGIDADQSKNLAEFLEDRKKISGKPWATLLIANDYEHPERLREAVQRARKAGAQWIFIDTAAGMNVMHSVAAELADIVLIPTTPGRKDQRGTRDTVKLVRQSGKRAFLLISKGSSSKAINDAAVTGLSSALGLPSVSSHIVLRTPTQTAEMSGETLLDLDSRETSVKNGQAEFRALWEWLRGQFDELTVDENEVGEVAHVQAG